MVLRKLLVAVLAVSPGSVFAGSVSYPLPMACSVENGKANINELKSKGGGGGAGNANLEFVEFKVLQNGVDVTGWSICASEQAGAISCFDIGVGDGTWYTSAEPDGTPDDSKSVYDANTWVTYNFKSLKSEEGEVILFDASGNVIDYIRWSNQAGICTSDEFSWDVPGSCGSCFDERDPDQKDFARGPDGTGDWGNNGDEPTEGDTNDTSSPAADHFAMVHDGAAVNCQAEPVTIVAHDAAHAPLAGYATLVTLATSTAHGDWTGIAAGGGTLTNNGNGSATYQFIATDNGQATLLLQDTFVENVNINVSDGTAVEAFAEDPSLAFARSGFALRVNGAPGVLPTQIAGKPSDTGYNAALLELQSINTNDDTGACEALLVGPVNVDFALECLDPGSCAASTMQVNGTPLPSNNAGAVASYAPVALDFGDATDSTASLVLQYDDAGQVAVHALLDPGFISTETLNGSTSLIVRPFGFDLAIDGGAITAVNPAATGAADAAFTHAGENFNVNVRAVAWQAGDDMDNDGVADGHDDTDPSTRADLSDNATTPRFGAEAVSSAVDLSAYLAAPGTGTDPGLAGTTTLNAFTNGAGIAGAVRYDEVGIIEVKANMNGGAYLGSENVTGASGFVGRFIPAFFEVTVPADGCADAGGFTYSGQPIGIVNITAYAASGVGVRTFNYDGTLGFSKDVTLTEAGGVPGSLTNGGIAAADFADGIATITDAPAGVTFTFTDAETAPVTIQLRATDSDGVSSGSALEEGTQVRSGRLMLDDGTAMTISDGAVRVTLETWQEISPGVHEWSVHTDDTTCTVPGVADFGLVAGSYTDNLQDTETAITNLDFSAGAGTLTLSAPGPGNDGAVDIDAVVDSWLYFDSGSGLAPPTGSMTFFEIFETEPGFIDRHEVVN